MRTVLAFKRGKIVSPVECLSKKMVWGESATGKAIALLLLLCSRHCAWFAEEGRVCHIH